jgi:hypothetical protein
MKSYAPARQKPGECLPTENMQPELSTPSERGAAAFAATSVFSIYGAAHRKISIHILALAENLSWRYASASWFVVRLEHQGNNEKKNQKKKKISIGIGN